MNDVAKGERFNLTKETGGATDFYVGLGWNANTGGGDDFDLDVSVFGLDDGDPAKLADDDYFVYFKHLRTANGSILHSPDNLTGDGDGDDEFVQFYLDKIPANIKELSIVVTIYNARSRGQNFGQVNKAYARVCHMNADGSPAEQLLKYTLTDDYSKYSAIQVGSIYLRDDGQWAFNPTGVGIEAPGGGKAELGEVIDYYTN